MTGNTAVSIVAYLTPVDEIYRCIDSLALTNSVVSVDIVDNSRQEYIKEAVEKLSKMHTNLVISYIASDNIGYGAANNISIRRTLLKHDIAFHLVMNSDIEFRPDTVDTLVELMHSNPSIGMTIPMVVGLDGIEQSSYHPLPAPWDLICHRFLPRKFCAKRMERYEIKVCGKDAPVEVPYIHGCFMLIRTDALRKIGLFDERYFMYPEDIDLTRRIAVESKVYVIPWLKIIHAHRAESRKSLKMLRIHAVNMAKYFNKWGWIGSTRRSHPLK